MTARLLLIRHAAHADLGWRLTGRGDDESLTAEGERQAEALAGRVVAADPAEILVSPRPRTRRTAEAVARSTGVLLREEAQLDEIDFGDWTGRSFAELEGDPAWETWNRARGSARAPGGESMAEVAQRVYALAERMGVERDGTTVALVTHGDVIRALVARVLGLAFDNLLRFEVAPASVSVVEVAPWGMTLLGLNDTGAVGGGR